MAYRIRIPTPPGGHVDVEPLDGTFDKVRAIDSTPDGGIGIYGRSPAGRNNGRPVHTEWFPTKMCREGGRRRIPDWDFSLSLNVSEKIKGIIERFEPNVHQFSPVGYYTKRGTLLENRYFLVVCNRIDAVDRGRTTFVFNTITTNNGVVVSSWDSVQDLVRWGKENIIPSHISYETRSKIVINAKQSAGYHLWMDKYFNSRGFPFFSDELAEALIDADMYGAEMERLETV